jgi:hypothetical protein
VGASKAGTGLGLSLPEARSFAQSDFQKTVVSQGRPSG